MDEEVPAGFDKVVTGTTITNTYKPGITTVSGQKVWNLKGNSEDLLPESITVYIKDGESIVDTLTVKAGVNKDWSFTSKVLPKYRADGKTEINYTVEEVAVPGFAKVIEGTRITNTLETVKINGEKKWDMKGYSEELMPESIKVLIKNGEATVDELTVTAGEDKSWKFESRDLPKYEADGKTEIEYTVDEEVPAGFDKVVTGTTITNTYKPGTTTVSGQKVWNLKGNSEDLLPESITVYIKDGESIVDTLTVKAGVNKDWSFTSKVLQKYRADGKTEINYTVEEVAVPGFAKVIEGTRITNTLETVKIEGEKKWDMKGYSEELMPESIKVLIKNGEATVDELTVTAGEDKSWKFESRDLPKYEADGKTEIEYTVDEEVPAGFDKVVTGTTITNTLATVEVKVTKVWNDNNNVEGFRPESVTINLKKDSETIDTVELNESNNWTYTWQNLLKYEAGQEINYTVSEDPVANYSTKITKAADGTFTYTVTNSRTYEETEATVKKVWADNENNDGKRPVELKVTLSNGDEVTLNAANNWTATINNLPKYANGVEIEYTWTENEEGLPEGYTLTSSNKVGTVTTLTNSYTDEKTEATIVKVWDDNENNDGKRPTALKAVLSNGTVVTLNDANGWKVTVKGLPKYANGVEIEYTWTEDETGLPEGYTLISTDKKGTITTLTNSYEDELTEATIVKVWDDNENNDGKRPEELKVTLSNGMDVTLSEANSWTATIDNLPKYENGVEIEYTWTEDAAGLPEGYTLTSTDKNGTITTLTNSYEDELTEATVKKVWADNGNNDRKRPVELKVTLSNGDEVTLNEANGWTATIDNLPKYKDGDEIEYTWTEDAAGLPEGYTLTSSNKVGTVTTLTNSYTDEKTEATVKKVWNDANNQDGKRPTELKVTLSNGTDVTLNAANGWTATIDNLPKYKDGVEIEYTWTEDETGLPEGYTLTSAEKVGTITTLTNSRDTEKTQVSVEKIWSDSGNREGFRPETVTVKLLANGTEIKTTELSESNEWKYTWTGLPKYEGGKEITYTVAEDQLENYKVPVIEKVSETAWAYTVTNSRDYEETEVKVTKVWDDNNNAEGFRPASVTVNLMKGTEKIGESITLDKDNNWSYSWTELQKFENGAAIEYTVTEDPVANYSTQITKAADGIFTYTVTNSRTTEKTEVSVEKIWNDSNNREGFRPDEVTVKLLANGKEAGTITLNKDNSWKHTWTNLQKFEGGKEIEYTVSEDQLANYKKPVIAKVSETAWAYTVTNSRDYEETEVKVLKVWDDSDNKEGFRPESVTVNLMKGTEQIGDSITLNEDNEWTYTWTELQKYEGGQAINYTVTENPVAKYSTLITKADDDTFTYTVKNSRTVEKTKVSVEKIWEDSENVEGFRPESVTVKLLANGKEAGTATLDKANEWKYTWTDLQKFEGSKEIEYTVSEDQLKNYKTPVIAKVSETEWAYSVTNSRDYEETEASVIKVWDDADNQDGKRPASLSVKLLKDGMDSGYDVVLNEGNGWTAKLENLQKYANGNEIVYTWSEEALPLGYTLTNTDKVGTITTLTNSHTTEETEVKVSKVWEDSGNKEGFRPASVTVQLMADGKAAGDAVELNAENEWKHSWTKLQKYKGGEEIQYTVTETPVAGYKAPVIAKVSETEWIYTVTNSRDYEETEASVKKVWSDGHNQDGVRPTSLTVKLLANGNETEYSVTLKAANEWTAKIENLQKYADGKEIEYTWSESNLPEGYTLTNTSKDGTLTTLTNSHKTEETEVKVLKVWDDADNQDGYRPDEVTVNLLADGEVKETVKLNEANNWSYEWKELAKKAAGKDIDYTVTEDAVDKYTTSIVKTDEKTFTYTVTNSHKTEETEVNVTKVWNDADDQDGYRPDDVTVNLLADGKIIDTVTLSEENEWSYSWTKLDKKANGTDIDYTVTENAVAEYTTKIEKTGENSFSYTVTNSHTTEETDVDVLKVWNDADNQDGYRPDDVTVNLLADGKIIDTVTLSEENEWSYSWTKLAKKAEGKEIDYTVTEDAVAEYTTKIEKADANSFSYTVTNSHTTEETDVDVLKVWNDADNQDGYRPDDVTVNLLADGKIIDTVTLSEENEWSYSWTKLAKKAEGKEIDYTVTEDAVAEYTTKIEKADANSFSYTVTNSHTTEETDVDVLKVWNDADNQDGYRPDDVTVNLLADGKIIDTVTLSEENEWSYSWTKLDKKANGTDIDYTVTENAVAEYTTKIEKADANSFSYTVTNSHTTEETDVDVLKVWDDADDQDGYRPDDVTVNLLAEGKIIDTVTLSEENEWSYSWTKLDKKAAGVEIDYTVTENAVAEYTTKIEKADANSFSYTVTNSHTTEETDVDVLKVWDDADDQDGYRPDDVTVNLLADGKIIDTVTLSEENEWSYSWTKLDKKAAGVDINYTVTENAVDKYNTKIEKTAANSFSYTVTNSHTTEETDVDVKKVWNDKNNQDGYRPDDVTVNLLADGKIIDTVTLNEENEWSYSWTKLDKKAAGVDIDYTVTENAVDKYTTQITKAADGTFTYTITNSHTTEETDVKVKKVWDDKDNQDGYRPDDVTVKLLANGEETGKTVTLSAENNWSYSWTKLDKKAGGNDIDYTVTENAVAEYTANITKAADGTFTYTVTNTHKIEETEVKVLKVWEDADDQDGYRPEDVTVNLLADGKATGKTVKLSAANNWSEGWDKLDKKANGQDIDYTITEDEVEEYTAEIVKAEDGTFTYTLTNNHTTEETEATVKKVWILEEKEIKNPPESLTVKLLADDVETGKSVTLNAGNNWNATIDHLPKYRDHGTEIEYTWTEVDLPEGFELTDTSKDGTVTTLTNTYTVKPTELPLEATKILTGRMWTEEDNFEFTLAADEHNPEGAVLPGTTVKTADITNKTVTFDKIVFNKYGTFKFTITETEGHIKGVTYDTEPKEFTVVIKDDGVGKLYVDSVTNDAYVEIKNPYESCGEIQFFAKKILIGRDLTEGMYTFALKDEGGNTLQTASCDAEGKVAFEPITYTEADMVVDGQIVTERKYTYTISEVKPEGDELDKTVIYDGAVKEITVTLKDDQEGTITTDPETGDLGITFINTVVKIQKTDVSTGEELNGAHLRILDKTGAVVDEWDSETGKPHEAENLKIDEEYTLTETIVPKDYAFTADATFSVDKEGRITTSGLKAREDGVLLLEDKLAEKPEFEKKIKDTNDTTGETSDWQDSADYDIGDAVPYRLQATLADNVTDYLKYHITFHDYMDEGLTFNGIDKVTVNGTEVTADSYTLESGEHGFDLTMNWGDGETKITDASLNKAAIEVLFTATLNERAALGAEGNVNTGKLEYSCNPNVDQDGKPSEETEETKEDSVIAFTYKVEVNKLSETGAPLAGAEFTLEKKIEGDKLTLIDCIKADSGDMFTFKGLDDGTYILTETKKPEGYQGIDPIEFTVTADHTIVWEGEARDTILTKLTGNVITGEIEFTEDTGIGSLVTSVKNVPEPTSAAVKKIWKDAENRDGLRPLSLRIELLADGEGTGKFAVLDSSNNWTAMINNLPKMNNGKAIEYSWKEPAVFGYTLTGSQKNGILTTLTNTHGPDETEVNVRKVWVDANNAAGKRPDSITVQLYADGQAAGAAVKLDASNNWSYSWTKLAKNANEAGMTREIKYTVAETEIPEGYIAKTAGNASTGYVITNTFETGKLIIEKEFEIEPWEPFGPDDSPMDIPVIKTWNDNNNKDGNRPGAVTVRLLADGVEVATTQLAESNGWKTVFTGLPRLTAEKQKIVYTITEDPVEWYEAEIHGFNIRNNYKPELTSVTVRKEWDDNNNDQKLRPESIVMTLNNGMTVLLNAGNNWTATISDLPTRVNGQPATYTWTEQKVLNYGLTSVVTEGNTTTFTNTLWKRPETPPTEGKKPKTTGETVTFEEYKTPLGVESIINHVGDCFD
ncbi:Cna B-type domain-containing protein [Clostridiales bacterium FE2010]|nr:Cna B-type domain-containing protein [Clostridiales bacterium FE2010]